MTPNIMIINLALSRIGLQPLTSLNDNNVRSRVASEVWDVAFRGFLSDYPWSFATRRAALAQLALEDDGEKLYSLPNDFIKLIEITKPVPQPSMVSWAFHKLNEYSIELVDTKRVIRTMMTGVVIRYTSDDVNLAFFSPPALEAASLRLAVKLDTSLNAGANYQALSGFYQQTLQLAVGLDLPSSERRTMRPGWLNEVRQNA